MGKFLIVTFPFAEGFIESPADKVTDKVTDKLTSGERKFLNSLLPYLSEHEWLANAQARELTGREEGSAKRFLRALTNKNVLEVQGERKIGRIYLNCSKWTRRASPFRSI
ncbi:MAG: hypothetical protein FWH48_02505 [Oscillospiraceae bacterium]|nr:hypothetical protein [Oscillospiraceae bacterium]